MSLNFFLFRICPIFQVSNVTGVNLDLLRIFLNLLSGRMHCNEDKPAEFQIDETYSVPVSWLCVCEHCSSWEEGHYGDIHFVHGREVVFFRRVFYKGWYFRAGMFVLFWSAVLEERGSLEGT